MLVCAVLCAVKAVQNFDQPIFAKMIVSIASTYGVFIVSSLLALEPWYVSLSVKPPSGADDI